MANRGLGRGLGALIPSMGKTPEDETRAVMEISLDKIIPNRNQPRNKFDDDSLEELAESIKEFGVIQPIVIREIDGEEKYEIITGERRFRATRKVGMNTIPAIVVKEVDDISSLEMALIENIHRDNLSPMEKAYTFRQLIDEFRITHSQLSKKIGKSRTTITNSMRLLSLPIEVQKLINEEKISEGHARAILSIGEDKDKIRIANLIVRNGLSVRDVEKIIDRRKNPESKTKKRKVLQLTKLPDISNKISSYVNAPVKIQMGKRKGKIIIDFDSIKDLERIVGKIVR